MNAFDRVAYDERWYPYKGWHADYAGGEILYQPAIQQDRGEFLRFAAVLKRQIDKPVAATRALQVGLGMSGAAHALLHVLFGRVITVDHSQGNINNLIRIAPEYAEEVIYGNSNDPRTLSAAQDYAPYDLVFLDGGHLYDEVREDYIDYLPLCGGVLAIHDTVTRPGCEAKRFIQEMVNLPFNLIETGGVGLAWMETRLI